MRAERMGKLTAVAVLVRRCGRTSLHAALGACEALSGDEPPLDLAVLGQFKSGKSSLLNAVLGEAVFPGGVVPLTAVITRAAASSKRLAPGTHPDRSAEEILPARLAEFVNANRDPRHPRRGA